MVDQEEEALVGNLNNLSLSPNKAKEKLKSWLGRVVKIIITDERCLVGKFICTDRDGNTILENTWVYSDQIDDNNEPQVIGLALIPGKHIVKISLMRNVY